MPATTGSVSEQSGINNSTPGVSTAVGQVVDPHAFVPQSSVATTYGTFSLSSHGKWRYHLDDNNPQVEALNAGGSLHDLIDAQTVGGPAYQIDITIGGANDAAVIRGAAAGTVVEAGGVDNAVAGTPFVKGRLRATDVDSPVDFAVSSGPDHGSFSITAAGDWVYKLRNSDADVQALDAGDTLHDQITVTTVDGTARTIDITIEGADDRAVIRGATSGTVVEAGGIGNALGGTSPVKGRLRATDVDSSADFVFASAPSHGSFSITAAGDWVYKLRNTDAAVQALNVGDTLQDLVAVTTADGTAQVINITIEGANDAATILGRATGTVVESNEFPGGGPGTPTASGRLGARDVDSSATFVAQSSETTAYGRFSIDTDGVWRYRLDNRDTAVQALDDGDTLHDLVTVSTADGTTKVIDITIEGASDTSIDLADLAPSSGFFIQGEAGDGRTGYSVSSAGDVNGDGFADLIVGAKYNDDGGLHAGEAYVVFGKPSGFGVVNGGGHAVLDLAGLAPAEGFLIQGDTAGDYAGWSVSSAGDVNGDGFADLVVGARGGDDGGSFAGEAYVVFGSGSGFGAVDGTGRSVVDLTSFSPAQGFVVQGDAAGDETGLSVSSAGDINGDGFADLIVGARYGDGGGVRAGEAYVVFGRAPGFGTVDGTGRAVIDLSNVGSSFTAARGFIIQGDSPEDQAGISVSSAGDVNGDGFADLIVGAFRGDDGGSDAGEAYVVFGKASGFGTTDGTGRSVIDLTSLAAASGFIVQGDGTNDWTGFSVSSAGDINGDGFADVVVGAPLDSFGAGDAYVVFGKASGFGTLDGAGRSVIDLSSLAPSDGFVVLGGRAGGETGSAVSSAGDVNGDGLADLILGAPFDSEGGSYTGKAYLLFGKRSGFGTVDGTGRSVIDLANLGGADGFVIQGDAAGDKAGGSVASAGDVNGDGFDDLLVGAQFAGDGDAGGAYVLFGGAFAGSTAPVTTTGTSADEILIGGLGDDTLTGGGGADVFRGGAGDDRLVIGDLAFRSVDGGSGDDTLALGGFGLTLDLTDRVVAEKITGIERIGLAAGGVTTVRLDERAVLTGVAGGANGVHVLTVFGNGGDTVSFADVQWSNAGTIVEGSTTYDRYVSGDAEVRVVQGVTVSFPSPFDLTLLAPAQGFVIQGDEAGDLTGYGVSSAGDVNGDGFTDLIVGAPYGGGSDAGAAYVVFGHASGFGTVDGTGRAVIDLSNVGSSFTAAQGFVIQGDAADDRAGASVSTAGDVNGDGFADLIVGAARADDGGSDAGAAYVVFGNASGFGTVDGTGRAVIDLGNVGSSFTAAQGFVIQGDAAGDRAGGSVSSVGDVNGDGFDDLIVGATLADDGGYNAGAAYVVFGHASGFGTTDGTGRAVIDLSNAGANFTAAQGFVIQGGAARDYTGCSVSSAGDVNGDGFVDLIVGAFGNDDGADGYGGDAGAAYVVFGTASGFGTVDGTGRAVIDLTNAGSHFAAAQGFVIRGAGPYDFAGASVSSAGDVNGDGFADLIVGAPLSDEGDTDAGEAYVVFGTASGFGTVDGTGRAVIDLANLGAAQGFVILDDTAGDQAGHSVASAGDVNGDGFDDLIVGAGQTYVVFGKASGFGTLDGTGRAVIDLDNFSAAQGFVIQGNDASSAGDVNGDGFDDLIVGAPSGDDGGTNAGEAYVLYGGAFGGSSAPVATTGTAAAEMLIGGAGSDALSGGGGTDVIRGGAGNDTMTVPDLAFSSIDGGGGNDTLVLTGAGQSFDFTALSDDRVSSIETIDITGSGNNTLVLGGDDVLGLSAGGNADFTVVHSHNNLVIDGNAGDQISLPDWDPDGAGGAAAAVWQLVQSSVGLDGSSGGAYDVYDLVRGGSTLASIAIDSDITKL